MIISTYKSSTNKHIPCVVSTYPLGIIILIQKQKKLVILLPVDFWCHLQTVLQLIANAQNICNLIGLIDHTGLIILLISILHSLTKKLQHSLFLETVESTRRFLPLTNIATTAEKLLRRVRGLRHYL